jgi:hypothetical protein
VSRDQRPLVSRLDVMVMTHDFHLFFQLSNEIIRRCCKEISLDRIFDGYVQSSMKSLNDCITCCQAWKDTYQRTAKLHHKFSSCGWVLDQSSIFAQVDAFVQRCRDLIEVSNFFLLRLGILLILATPSCGF